MQFPQRSEFLIDVMRQAQAGRVVPASFQRPYVWEREHVEKFWESLQIGLPMGAFLFWRPDESVDYDKLTRGRMGPISAFEGRPTVVLDGQNRLGTFAWSLRTPDDAMPTNLSPAEKRTWDSGMSLVADGRDRTVSFRKDSEARDPHCFAPGTLIDSMNIRVITHRERLGASFDDAQIDFLFDEIPRKIRESRCSTLTMEGATTEEALFAFKHICRTGVPMSEEDFDAAMAWAVPESPGFAP